MRSCSFAFFCAFVSGCSCSEPVAVIDQRDPSDPLPTEGEGEGGEGEGEGGEGEGEAPACSASDLTLLGSADKPRVMLVTFPFAEPAGTDGTIIKSFSVENGEIAGPLDSVDVGFRPANVALSPSGTLAVVVAEESGQAVVVDTSDPADLRITGTLVTGAAGFDDLHVTSQLVPGGVAVYAVSFDSAATGGVHAWTLSCDGALSAPSEPLALRLSSSLALLPDDRAVLLGGQAEFDPIDPLDLRVLDLAGGGAAEVDAFDVYASFVTATQIDAASDGSFVVVPNSATFGDDIGDIVVVDVDGDTLTERGRLEEDFPTASQALLSPDDTVVAISQWEEDCVRFFDVSGQTPVLINTVIIGLAEHMAMIERGAQAGRLFVPEVDPAGGSFIAVVDVAAGGGVEAPRFALGDGTLDIPFAIALAP